jgi:hypothetical protein
LATDLRAPSTFVLRRVPDQRVHQFWDKDRLLSKALGEKGRSTIVWDQIAVYDSESRWDERPPNPRFVDRPVVHVIDDAGEALAGVH